MLPVTVNVTRGACAVLGTRFVQCLSREQYVALPAIDRELYLARLQVVSE